MPLRQQIEMNYSSPPTIPYSPDPAIFLHSELGGSSSKAHLHLPANDSDDLEALHIQQAEATAEKNKRGVVIRHRAWKVADAFRSDEGYQAESPIRDRANFGRAALGIPAAGNADVLPSSPPIMAAVQESSPMAAAVMTRGSISQGIDRDNGWTGSVPHYSEFYDKVEKSTPTRAAATTNNGLEMMEDLNQSRRNDPLRFGPFLLDDDDSENDARSPTSQSFSRDNDVSISKPLGVVDSGRSSFPAPPPSKSTTCDASRRRYSIRTCSGKSFEISKKPTVMPISFEQLISSRSFTAPGRARKSYYGIDIHKLLDENARETGKSTDLAGTRQPEVPTPSIEEAQGSGPRPGSSGKTLLWTEKYRAKTFTDLIGDERTHRSVLRWLKGWDPIVFPRQRRMKVTPGEPKDGSEERHHRKILLLTGPPGLGKTTLAHVAARQAGYEVLEINASDERSKSVVQGRIRDSLGTENVRTLGTRTANGKARKPGKPVCIIVDEVDGVVGGSSGGGGSGEGGFIQALIDLTTLDAKNSSPRTTGLSANTTARKKRKGDDFRFLRPLILICNDVYHPSLRPLRHSSVAEIIHVKKPPLNLVVSRMKAIFEKEGLPCDGDGVRRLCEATWGLSSRREAGSSSSGVGEGDIRGVMVVGEWVAGKLRSSLPGTARLTRNWIEQHMLGDLNDDGAGARGLGRGGYKEVVRRVFLEGAGFPKPTSLEPTDDIPGYGKKIGVSELSKRRAMGWLREMVDSGGECDRVITDCFSTYLSQPYQDDTLLSKPNAAYDWLHFHDALDSRIFADQEWELTPYLSQPVLSFHHLFASATRHTQASDFGENRFGEGDDGDPVPFTGPKADFAAHETLKSNRALLLNLQSSLSIPLLRSFRSPEELATDLVPYLNKILMPNVKPVVVGGSGDQRGIASVRKGNEREMVRRAVEVMTGVGVTFEKGRLELEAGGRDGGWVYRMEPPIDILATFQTGAIAQGAASAPIRYAVRQVLDQEYQKDLVRQRNEARQARFRAGSPLGESAPRHPMHKDKPAAPHSAKSRLAGAKRDFFGRILNEAIPRASNEEGDADADGPGNAARKKRKSSGPDQENKVWISFHEGFSNAVRKPITLEEILRGL